MAAPTLGAMIAAMGSPAEWGAIATTKFYWDDANGRLGIGTTSPNGTLTVRNINDGAEILTLSTAYQNPSGRQSLTWRDSSNITGQIDTSYSGGIISMNFGHLYNAGYQTGDILTIKGNGNVGIGTTSPGQKLEVAGAILSSQTIGVNNPRVIYYDDTNYASYVTFDASAHTYYRTGGDWIWQNVPTGATRYSAAGTQVMSLSMIGTLTTVGNLTVQGTGNTTIAGNVGIGTTALDERLTLIVADNSGDCKLKVGNNLTDKNGVLGYSDGSDFLYVQGGVWGGQTRQLNLQGGGGNVCVGAFSTTGAKLSVDGGLNVGAGNDPGDNNLVVQGTAYIYGTLDAGLGGSTGTTMVYSGTRIYWNNSSERFKEDITRNWKSGKLADYLKISPIKFKPKREIGDHNGDPVNPYALGFSAEEVHASGVPGLINYDKEEKPMSLREHGFLVYHHLILQEFEKRIAALEGR